MIKSKKVSTEIKKLFNKIGGFKELENMEVVAKNKNGTVFYVDIDTYMDGKTQFIFTAENKDQVIDTDIVTEENIEAMYLKYLTFVI